MNDSTKQLITGAVIALTGVVAGGAMVIWTQAVIKNEAARVNSGKPSVINFQPPANIGQLSPVPNQPVSFNGQRPSFSAQPSVFSGQRIQPNPTFTIPPRPSGSNFAFRACQATGKPMVLNNSQFQKVQDLPDVKAAREAVKEAQKKYAAAMQAAMAKTDPQSGAKTAPLTIQVPPTGSTNGVGKRGM
jgi:hypothetical protein